MRRGSLLGLQVHDCHGAEVGRIVDTWPSDGGWEIEMVVIRLSRFGERRMLPIEALLAWGSAVSCAHTKRQIEDSPLTGEGVHRDDDPYRALAYWRWEEPAAGGKVPPPWRRSSGFFGTERPSLTSPNPTPTAS